MNESANNPGFLSKHAKDIVVIVLLALLVYVMVEQAVRFSLFGPAAFSYRQMNSIKSLGRSGFVKASEYDEVVYDLKRRHRELTIVVNGGIRTLDAAASETTVAASGRLSLNTAPPPESGSSDRRPPCSSTMP